MSPPTKQIGPQWLVILLTEYENNNLSPERVSLFARAFFDHGPAELERAALIAIKRCKYFPSSHEFNEILEGLPKFDDPSTWKTCQSCEELSPAPNSNQCPACIDIAQIQAADDYEPIEVAAEIANHLIAEASTRRLVGPTLALADSYRQVEKVNW